ncbi:putative glycoside hydrolase [Sulfurimonas sp.]|uniref:putative glycoside hydrolase n=1 Tax=Sulfurimonas sp. TaxID=2022749 RepID=UPI003564A67D
MKILFLTFLIISNIFAISFKGKIVDSVTKEPIIDAKISDSNQTIHSHIFGHFVLDSNEEVAFIKAYGYKPKKFKLSELSKTIELTPIKVKALYLNFWGAKIDSKTFARILKIIDETEINSVVVDIKSAEGLTSYKTSYDKANSYGAWFQRSIKDIDEFMSVLKSKNIYTIARLSTFKDDLQAKNNPDYAIKTKNGEVWRNFDGIAWVDPYDKRSHIYTIEIAKDAAKVGFDEINFDFIRFPARRGLVFSKENTEQNRIKAIEEFLSLAQNELRRYGVFVSVDTYGLICWNETDTGIGQTIKGLSKYADYICPMLYPSGFSSSYFNVKNPADYPHKVIYESINNVVDQINPLRLRPWLQHFKDYTQEKRFYVKKDIEAQIRASEEHDTNGWMMWSPSSRYKQNYFRLTAISRIDSE